MARAAKGCQSRLPRKAGTRGLSLPAARGAAEGFKAAGFVFTECKDKTVV